MTGRLAGAPRPTAGDTVERALPPTLDKVVQATHRWLARGTFGSPSGIVRARDLTDPEVAAGNCWNATRGLRDALVRRSVPPETVGYLHARGWPYVGREHHALLVDVPQNELPPDQFMVVDVTGRQYDPAAPAVLVAAMEDFEERVARWLGAEPDADRMLAQYDDEWPG